MRNLVSRRVWTKGDPERSPFWHLRVWPGIVPVPLSGGDRLVSGKRFRASLGIGPV